VCDVELCFTLVWHWVQGWAIVTEPSNLRKSNRIVYYQLVKDGSAPHSVVVTMLIILMVGHSGQAAT
jgi:hypothetical protein